MSKTIRIEYYGMGGEGPTVKEAKADAGRKLQELVRDAGHSPVVVKAGNQAVLVHRETHGWTTILLTDEHGSVRGGQVYGTSGDRSREEAIRSAAMHVIQNAWRHEIEDDAAYIEACLAPVNMPRDAKKTVAGELRSYFGWQRSYKAAREQGHDDQDARYIAGGCQHLVKAAA